ncbi:hypothetical protein FisN_9Lu404 [Fistulifera solaris]|uniref:Uncharacterized protein n=1 Tax=Fistulifera solaris TaxID=1519565 RepID=A0A1Z5KM13_FISSO|nr:hypothetical protein FisN_9Lu404 [Fistulifera solaris]|eukprot:GAX27071.1 hypothetical protein FisN_9Lu404 [Fistulifera solaris]
MYIPANESSTRTVDDECLCELSMPLYQEESPSRNQKKTVSFASEALLYSTPFFMDEIRALWYSQDEYLSLREERRTAVKLLRVYGVETVKRKVCLRGLEAYFSVETNRAMKEARDLAVISVLHEQDLQRKLGFYDAEGLRSVYVPATQCMRDFALQLARNNDSLSVDKLGLTLTQSIPMNTRNTFQDAMTQQRTQKRQLREDIEGMDRIIKNTKALDINTSSRAYHDEFAHVRINRI